VWRLRLGTQRCVTPGNQCFTWRAGASMDRRREGWARGPAESGYLGIVLVEVVFVIVQFFSLGKHSDFQTPGKYRLALKYGLTEDEVFMDPKRQAVILPMPR
jgi:hypothetical protein